MHKIFKNNIYLLKIIWKCSKIKLILHTTIGVMQAIVDFLTQIYFFNILIRLIEQESNFSQYLFMTLLILSLQLLKSMIVTWYFSYISPKLDIDIDEKLKKLLIDKSLKLPIIIYENPKFYDIQNRVTTNITLKIPQILNNLSNILGFIIISTSTIVFAVLQSPFVLLFLMFPVLFIFFNNKINYFIYSRNKEEIPLNRCQQYVQTAFFTKEHAKELRTSNLSTVLKGILISSNKKFTDIRKKYGLKLAFTSTIATLLGSNLPIVAANFYAAYCFAFTHNLTITGFSVLITSINTFCNRINRLFSFLTTAQEHSLYIEDLKNFLKQPEIASTPKKTVPLFETLECNNLKFSYDGINNVINGIDVTIHNGEKIAIVGPNGSGKSTFVKLLLNLYTPTSGSITYNGQNIEKLDLTQFYQKFGVAFQDFKTYEISVAENVLMDKLTQSKIPSVKEALKRMDILDIFKGTLRGINTPLTRRFEVDGMILSGGQNQKIAISRLLTSTWSIAILDEPSSALDPIAEQQIYEQLFKTNYDKTMIIISHRLSVATMVDKILFFKNGKILESGSHQQLMDKNGEYARMFKLQAKSYQESEVCN